MIDRPFASVMLLAALALVLIALIACTSTPEPVVVTYELDETGTPACAVGDETHYLTERERELIANALIREYAPDYCSTD